MWISCGEAMKAGPQDSSNPQTTTAEDDTLKRNTDCVYFLASPLTCKKGNQCDYRHSEEARVNPRDCWYWMNGNCLNPKCSFRHPPLDGLLGTAVTTSTKSLPPSLAVAPKQLPTSHNPASSLDKQVNPHRQATPCYYFQTGLCLKGDRCPFMHEPLPVDNSVPQPPATKVPIFVTEPQIPKKPIVGLQRCSTQQQRIHQGNIIRPVEVPSAAQQPAKPEFALSKNGMVVKKTMPQTTSFNYEVPRYKPTNVPPVMSGDSVSRTHRSRQAYPLDYPSFQNGKEPDEFLAESSPGFDVLVDDELRGSDYYQNEDEFGRMAGHERRHVNAINDFNYKRSSGYSSVGKFDQETYNDSRGYDSYEWVQAQYVQEQRRPSSERISERPILLERRGYSRAQSPNQVDMSDLRFRLKHRKVNGLRSAVSPDRHGKFYGRDDRDPKIGDHRFHDHSRRDSCSSVPREISQRSNRLQGRIKLPGRSSPDNNNNDSHQERESDRGRNRGRLSPPGRLPTSSYQGRLQDRIKQRTHEDFSAEGRNLRGASIKRDEVDKSTVNFSGPKSLAELKGSKFDEKRPKNTQTRKLVNYQESEGSHSFEGPKPLNVILKRKREAGTAGSGDDIVSGNEDETNQRRKGKLPLTRSRTSGVAEKQSEVLFDSKIEEAHSSKEEDVEEEEGLISAEGVEVTHESHSSVQRESELQEEDAMTDKLEEQEFESFDRRDGESDYEPVEGDGNFKTEEDDANVEAEEEFSDDDEDGDDFAKRIGVMFS